MSSVLETRRASYLRVGRFESPSLRARQFPHRHLGMIRAVGAMPGIAAGVVGVWFCIGCGGNRAGAPGPTNSSRSTTPARGVRASPPSERIFAVGAAPGSVAIDDFNGDGKLDIVTANEESGDASVLLGDGNGEFSPARGSPFPAGASPNDIAVGDFNRDGW